MDVEVEELATMMLRDPNKFEKVRVSPPMWVAGQGA